MGAAAITGVGRGIGSQGIAHDEAREVPEEGLRWPAQAAGSEAEGGVQQRRGVPGGGGGVIVSISVIWRVSPSGESGSFSETGGLPCFTKTASFTAGGIFLSVRMLEFRRSG